MRNIYFKIQRAIACILIQRKQRLNFSEPIISFTFDDVPNSAFVNGSNILKKYGYRGTYYISLGLSDVKRIEGGYFDCAHLQKMVDEGGELGCHTFNHIHLYASNKEQIKSDLNKNQQKINEIIPGYKFSNFSYPYGEQTFTSKIFIRKRYTSARSVKSGINTCNTDLNNLKAVQIDDENKFNEMVKFIDDAILAKAWLIFYTHDVEESPSAWGCTPAYFEKVVKYCHDKKIKVLNIEKTLHLIRSSAVN